MRASFAWIGPILISCFSPKSQRGRISNILHHWLNKSLVLVVNVTVILGRLKIPNLSSIFFFLIFDFYLDLSSLLYYFPTSKLFFILPQPLANELLDFLLLIKYNSRSGFCGLSVPQKKCNYVSMFYFFFNLMRTSPLHPSCHCTFMYFAKNKIFVYIQKSYIHGVLLGHH